MVLTSNALRMSPFEIREVAVCDINNRLISLNLDILVKKWLVFNHYLGHGPNLRSPLLTFHPTICKGQSGIPLE
jgi:hypothetical protein